MEFINRTAELIGLNQRYADERAELFVLYGRRRTGKTALLREFCRGKAHVYFLAAQLREPDNLRQLKEDILTARPDPLLAAMSFTGWDVVLSYLAKLAENEQFILVLDEFPYLCQENPALPSILQRWWDTTGKHTRLFLILCGSHVGFMENEVLAERSPLYGRRTGQAKLGPLLPWDAGLFFLRYTAREKLIAYGILGGIPAYLERFSTTRNIHENLLREALNGQGFFFEEVNFLLRTELNHIATYLSILKAVAGGATRTSEIASRAGITATGATKYIGILRDMGLLRREVPATEEYPDKSKRGLYVIDDPFVAFWCRFILPYQGLIQAGQGETVWQEYIDPQLNTHLGLVFEEVCRLYVLHRWGERHGETPLRVGRWWSGDSEIDVFAEIQQHSQAMILVGECKWWQKPVGKNVLEELQRKTAAIPLASNRKFQYALFSVSGFTDALMERAKDEGIILIDAPQIMS
ncbi:MAG: ATP-binding protein [bacterium]